jgi:hypothetical protein
MNSTEAADVQSARGAARRTATDARSKRFGILGWFALLCLVAAITLASYVIFHSYRFSLNTDGAVEDILAKLAIEEGRLVPHNWTYANGDLWILGPRLFLVIAFPWLGLGYLLHASATWLTYLYLLLMVYGTCRVLAPRRTRAAIFASLLAAGCLSTLNFEFVIGQGAYSLYAALALALFALAARGFEQSQRSSAMTLTLICVAALLVCISNATRGIVTVIAPLLTGWLAATLTSNQQRGFRAKTFYYPIAATVGACGGIATFRYWLLPGVVNSVGAAKSQLAPLPEAAHHMTLLPFAWFTYFGIHGGWEWLSPPWRVLQAFVWLLAVVLLLAPLRVVSARKHYSASLQAFSWMALACYAISFAALVASRNLFDGPASMRYATFAVYASVCALAIQVDRMLEWRPKIFAVPAILLCIIPVATIADWRAEWTPGGITYAQRSALISSLEKRNIRRVLATYWNSEVLSVLSDGKIEGLPVDVDATAGLRRHAQNSPRTAIHGFNGKQAVALTTSEASVATWKKLGSQLGEPMQHYRSGPFIVAVYDRSLARRFYDAEAIADTSVPSDKLAIRLSRTKLAPCRSVHPCRYWVNVTNAGKSPLATAGTKPFRLGIHGIDAQGRIVEWDAGRVDFPSPVLSGETERVEVVLPHPAEPQVANYQLCLLQEQVAWHCDRTKGSGNPTSH